MIESCLQNCPTNGEIEKLVQEIDEKYATKKKLENVKDSIQNFVTIDEYNITKVLAENNHDDLRSFEKIYIEKDDVNAQLKSLNQIIQK